MTQVPEFVVESLKRWAFQALVASGPEYLSKWEIGSGLNSLLEEAFPLPPDDSPGPRTPCTTLLGQPLVEDKALAPDEWRVLDVEGNVLATGVFTV